ncbi:MAG: hypothetical protein AB1758_36960 [Candidatus Eremiobacterota bacterium]
MQDRPLPSPPLRRRGGAIVFVLLMTTLFFLLAIAMTSQSQSALKASQGSARAAEARALAWAGLADARGKLARDLRFPPWAEDQRVFTYTEDVADVDSTEIVGSYNVTVDLSWARDPYFVIRLRSEGVLGQRTQPVARRVLVADLDMSDPTGNPALFQLLRYQDLGVP